MNGNEIRPRNAITIEDYAIGSAAGANGSIADFGQAKSAVFLPYMLDRNVCMRGLALHNDACRRTRTVIGHDDLERTVGLAHQGTQHGVKRVLALVGGENDGDQPGHQRLYGSSLPPA